MFDNKSFDEADNIIIINGVHYADTNGFYELIFKRIPDDLFYTENICTSTKVYCWRQTRINTSIIRVLSN